MWERLWLWLRALMHRIYVWWRRKMMQRHAATTVDAIRDLLKLRNMHRADIEPYLIQHLGAEISTKRLGGGLIRVTIVYKTVGPVYGQGPNIRACYDQLIKKLSVMEAVELIPRD